MSVKVFFMRHGQSVANLQDYFYNDEDAPLTPLGCEQAREAGRKLKESGIKFDAIYCSTYERARETCRLVLEQLGIDEKSVIIDERIEERKFDGLIGKTASDEHYRELFRYDSGRSEEDGVETLPALEERAKDFIDMLKEKHDGEKVLIFSHGCFGMAFYVVLKGRPKSGSYHDDLHLLKNCEVYETII